MKKLLIRAILVITGIIIILGIGAVYLLGIFPPIPHTAASDTSPIQPHPVTSADVYLKKLHWTASSSRLVFDDKTGQLRIASNTLPFHALNIADVKLTPNEALILSRKYAAIAGFSLKGLQVTRNELYESRQSDSLQPPVQKLAWIVTYKWTYHGYPFSGYAAMFNLNPATGDLNRMRFDTTVPLPPHSTVPRISKGMAERLATMGLIIKAGIHPDRITSSKLMILPYFDEKTMTSFGSYLGWLVSFTWDGGHVATVSIDSTTCRVIHIYHCM